ncbi:hypothetical protein, partial [uncultured Pseudomonas sp.]|uniref:hypothetical protein n=1 Tax=uncultured Pseudomonas sp. TaxID=114707 RepID=UPI0030D9CA06
EAGSWKLEAGSWKLEAGSWKLEAGSWKVLGFRDLGATERAKINSSHFRLLASSFQHLSK